MKKLLLFIVGLFFLVGFFQIKVYQDWKDIKITNPDPFEQFKVQDLQERIKMRFGPAWELCESMKSQIDTAKDRDSALVLLPPNSYIESQNIRFNVPEPAVIYYLCGIKSTWTTGANVQKANYAVVVVPGRGLAFKKIEGPAELKQLLETYKNYQPAL